MTPRRLFLAALTTVTIAAAAPSAALAAGWTEPEILSADGAPISQLSDPSANNFLAAAPDGSVTVAWIQSDGSNDRLVARRFSASTRSWSDAQYVSAAGEDLYTAGVVMDSDGNATAFWTPPGFSTVKASTLLVGENDWSAPHTLVSGGAYGYGAAAGPDGTVVLVLSESDGEVRVHTRTRNAASWDATTPATIATDGTVVTGAISIDYNTSGDGVMLFGGNKAGSNNAYVSRFDADAGTWAATPTLMFENVVAGFTGMQSVVIAANGDIAATVDDGSFRVLARTLKADDTLAAQQELGSGFRLIPKVVADDTNRFLLGWESLDGGTFMASGEYSVSDPDTGTFGTPDFLPGGNPGAPLGLQSTDSGTVRTVMGLGLGLASIADFQLAGATWDSATGTWSDLEPIEGESVTVRNSFYNTGYGHQPRVTMAESGDLFVMWSQNLPGSTFGIGFAASDHSGPAIGDLSVPDSGVAETPLSFSASASDVWSEIASTTWRFGDGDSATGSTVSHAYAEAGTYTVTVTATDTAGNATSRTRQITVAPAPAPPVLPITPKPPVLAPVIEARLSGKTITLTAKVGLRSGKSCSGKATATTSFGNTTYRTTLTLKKVGKDCVGTGVIKLKKAPSTRTKLRVTVSSKSTKTRTITTKRG